MSTLKKGGVKVKDQIGCKPVRGSGVQVLDLSHNFSVEKHLQNERKEMMDSGEKYFNCGCYGNT